MAIIEIPDTDATSLLNRYREMEAIYADKTRNDWFAADDIAREMAEYFGRQLEKLL